MAFGNFSSVTRYTHRNNPLMKTEFESGAVNEPESVKRQLMQQIVRCSFSLSLFSYFFPAPWGPMHCVGRPSQPHI